VRLVEDERAAAEGVGCGRARLPVEEDDDGDAPDSQVIEL
jgi:hypothetical protein